VFKHIFYFLYHFYLTYLPEKWFCLRKARAKNIMHLTDKEKRKTRLFQRRHRVIKNARKRFFNELDVKTILEAVRFCKFMFHSLGSYKKVLLNFQKSSVITEKN